MKKLVITALAAVLLPTFVFAQGTVSFASAATTDAVLGPVQRVYLESTLAPAGAGTTAQLWWSPDNIVAYSQIASAVVSTTSGRITPAVVAITGLATSGGASAWFYVYGENLGLAVSGRTPNFLNPTGNPGITPPTLPADLTGWGSTVGPVLMSGAVIPEPSTIALAGLGLAALLAIRRRK